MALAALAFSGCVPKRPPVANAGGNKPPALADRLAAVEAAQAAIKSRQDAQESTMTALQAHMALLDSRLDMIEYSLHIGKGSAFAQAAHPMPKKQPPAALYIAPVPKKLPPKPVSAPPAKAPPASVPAKAAAAPTAKKAAAGASAKAAATPPPVPKLPAMSKAERAKMQKAFDDAMQLLKSGDYEKATSALASFVRQYPHTEHAPTARYWLGEALFAQMQVAKAVDALKPFASMPVTTPKRAPALFRLGAGYQRLGSKTDAARVFSILSHDYPGTIEANNAARQLKALGIVAPPPAPGPQSQAAAQPAAATPLRQHWAVNIVSLDARADARHTLARLHRQGLHATMMKVKVAGKLWYRLRLTGYAGRPAAEHERLQVIKKGYAGAWVSPE